MVYLWLIIGLALLLIGANYLVESSVAIAQRAKISNFIIGLTIVGMGTSAPELFISISSALTGHGDMAVGNVVGSNICNFLLILGATAVICPFMIQNEVRKRDIPVGIVVAVLLLFLANDSIIPGIAENSLNRLDGVFFLIIFVVYMSSVIISKGKNPEQAVAEADEETKTSLAGKAPWLLWSIAAVSLVALIGGGQVFLDSAQTLARQWGVSEAVISITIVAIGTSLPELITAIIAASKGNPELALGNVIGSNVFNILLILGLTATISPITVSDISIVDYVMVIFAATLTWVVLKTFAKNKFDRVEGIIFLLIYVAYNLYLMLK